MDVYNENVNAEHVPHVGNVCPVPANTDHHAQRMRTMFNPIDDFLMNDYVISFDKMNYLTQVLNLR